MSVSYPPQPYPKWNPRRLYELSIFFRDSPENPPPCMDFYSSIVVHVPKKHKKHECQASNLQVGILVPFDVVRVSDFFWRILDDQKRNISGNWPLYIYIHFEPFSTFFQIKGRFWS